MERCITIACWGDWARSLAGVGGKPHGEVHHNRDSAMASAFMTD
jgi:hypothetical protein